MKLIYAVFALSAVVSSISAKPVLNRYMKRDVDPNLIPQFGVTPGVNPSGAGNCDGIRKNNNTILIPCKCPPPRDKFIADLNANVAAGFCINNTAVTVPPFPTDNSTNSQLTRLHISTITLQNLEGRGNGCPQSSTTWAQQVLDIQAAASSASSSSTAAARIAVPTANPSFTSPSPASSAFPPSSTGTSVPVDLIPQFGVTAGVNPSGTGNCDGIRKNNNTILIPCKCPPPRDKFIADLNANVAAGVCINNTAVTVPPFPTDNSTNSQLTILHICTITLQNLEGRGNGCPQSSTTWAQQVLDIQAAASSASSSSAATVRVADPTANPSSTSPSPSSSAQSSADPSAATCSAVSMNSRSSPPS